MDSLLIIEKDSEDTKKKQMMQYFKKPSGSIYLTSEEVSMLGRKTFNFLLKHAQLEMLKVDTHEMDISIFREGVNSQANTNYLKQALKKLVGTAVEWDLINRDNKHEWGTASLLSSARIVDGKKLYYSFPTDLKPLLADPTVYALIDIKMQNKFSSKYAVTLYEIAVDYYRDSDQVGETPYISMEEFKKIMGVSNIKSYNTFSNLKKFVIEAPMREVNAETPYEMRYKLEKKGRNYTHIKFLIRKPQLLAAIKQNDSIQIKDIPQGLLNMIPEGQQANCRQICIEILKSNGEEGLEFYIEYVKKFEKKEKVNSWGPFLRKPFANKEFEKNQEEIVLKKSANQQAKKKEIEKYHLMDDVEFEMAYLNQDPLAIQIWDEGRGKEILQKKEKQSQEKALLDKMIDNLLKSEQTAFTDYISQKVNDNSILKKRYKEWVAKIQVSNDIEETLIIKNLHRKYVAEYMNLNNQNSTLKSESNDKKIAHIKKLVAEYEEMNSELNGSESDNYDEIKKILSKTS